MNLRAADVKYLALEVARIVRDNGLVKTTDLVAGTDFHLRPVPAEVEDHNVTGLGPGDQVVLYRGNNIGMGRRRPLQDLDILWQKPEFRGQQLVHVLHVIDGARERRNLLRVTVLIDTH